MTSWAPPPWAGAPRGQAGIPDPHLRVSDAERAQVADALSRHFAEGRLDAQEHDERLQRAMAARTRADLAGLLSDLPPPVPVAPPPLRRRRGGVVVLLVTTFLLAAAFSSALWAWHFPWLLFVLVFFLLWRRSHRGWHRHGPWGWHAPVPSAEAESGPPYWVYGPRRRWWV
jgi:hypothetical protein